MRSALHRHLYGVFPLILFCCQQWNIIPVMENMWCSLRFLVACVSPVSPWCLPSLVCVCVSKAFCLLAPATSQAHQPQHWSSVAHQQFVPPAEVVTTLAAQRYYMSLSSSVVFSFSAIIAVYYSTQPSASAQPTSTTHSQINPFNLPFYVCFLGN